jgi:phage portal protein BeeE
MGILRSATHSASLSEPAAPAPAVAQGSSASSPSASLYRAQAVAIEVAMQIPSVRKALHTIAGTPSTFDLYAWQGDTRLDPLDPRASWLRQPDPQRTLQWLLGKTLRDGVWHDRCVWEIERNIADVPTRFRRVHPSRISTIDEPLDPDTVAAWIIDGKLVSNMRDYLVFDFGGLGGLRRYGWSLLSLYADLQAAAGNYARAPHPKAILKNAGPDLEPDEIDELLADWEASRDTSSVGYLNSSMSYDTHGWNPKELQLVEAREHAALEAARLFGLPAKAVDAQSGDSMTYGTVVEYRRDLLEALRPWMRVITATLSLDDRTAAPKGLILPRGIRAEFDVDAFTRDDPSTRMATWAAGLASEALTLEEVRSNEPLARKV